MGHCRALFLGLYHRAILSFSPTLVRTEVQVNAVGIWKETFDRYEGRCFICAQSEHEGAALGVVSIFMERQVNLETMHPLEFVLCCIADRKTIEEHVRDGKRGTGNGIMRKYWRIRGSIAESIDKGRKEEADARSSRRIEKRSAR